MKNIRDTFIWLAVVLFLLPAAAAILNRLLPLIVSLAGIVAVMAFIFRTRR